MTDLLKRLKEQLATQRLMKRGGSVVVAVSGGVDSMVLLHLLHALAPGFGWKLSVAHFNHHLRGRSSDADERLVRATARRLKLPCDVETADVRQAAAKQGESIEMAARRLRHAFLAHCARRRDARTVVLAHHADDQVELFLLRLLRGAGSDGFGGMKERGVSPADRRIFLVRPFLGFPKEEIMEFARSAHIRFREDISNASVEFDRNWVRIELLPLLRKRQPAAGRTILRAMLIAGTEADFVTRAAEGWLKDKSSGRAIPNASFARLHVAVQRRVVQFQIRALGVEPDFQLIEKLRSNLNGTVNVKLGLGLVCDASGCVRRVQTEPPVFTPGQQTVELTGSASLRQRAGRNWVEFGGLRLQWRRVRRTKSFSPKSGTGREFFDADRVGARLVFRHWRAGDRFQPIGLAAATKLQDWFTNRKVSKDRRRKLVLAETERGELFWVEGERIGEICKVTPATRRMLELRWGKRDGRLR